MSGYERIEAVKAAMVASLEDRDTGAGSDLERDVHQLDENYWEVYGAIDMRQLAEVALRAAGGQEKPSDAPDTGKLRLLVEPHPNQWAAIQLHDAVLAAADEIDRLRAAAPVGGQAEPSDAEVRANPLPCAPQCHYFGSGWATCAYCGANNPAAAVSGEQE